MSDIIMGTFYLDLILLAVLDVKFLAYIVSSNRYDT